MIKIDLGKDAEERAKGKRKTKAPSVTMPQGLNLGKSDFSGGLFLLGALAFAFLPFLFVEQYKESVREKNRASLSSLEETKNKIKEEINQYQSYKVELENFEKQSKLISERLQAVNDLLASRSGPVSVLDAIGQSLPARAWLTDLSFKSDQDPLIIFSGLAYSHEDITDFSDKLNASIFFEKVNLESVTEGGGIKGQELKNFSFQTVPKASNRSAASMSDPKAAKK
jgi:Tfp pilus assembly protein PilN